MPKTKEQKKDIVASLRDKISRSKSVVFANFDKLSVKENEELRNNLKAENGEYYVAKKTLLDLAFGEAKIDGLDIKKMDGRVAAVFGFEDEVAPAKIVDKFKDAHEEKVGFLGGILEEKFIDREEVQALAKLPGRDELYAKIVGSINAPVSGFVNVLAGNMRGLVYVLKAIEEKK